MHIAPILVLEAVVTLAGIAASGFLMPIFYRFSPCVSK